MVRTGMALCAALLASPVLAADTDRAAERALAPLVACRHTADPQARVACYDAALDRLQRAVATREVAITDRQQVAQDKRRLFGFGPSHPDEPKPAKVAKAPRAAAAPSDEVAQIDSTITAASPYGYDRWTLQLATGAVWRTTEYGIPVAPKPGTPVHIHRGLMNSYMLRVGSGRAIRAMRVG